MTPEKTCSNARGALPRAVAPLAALFLLAGAGAGIALAPRTALAEPGPSSFAAVYQVRFLGLPIGKAKVWVNLSGDVYSMQGTTKLSFLKGLMFELKGGASATGRIVAAGPRPAHYGLAFEVRKRMGRLSMTFEDDAVSAVAIQPPITQHPRTVPVAKKHVRGVFDPLSALFLAGKTQKNGLDPRVCMRRIPIFDGTHRYDLQLSFLRTEMLKQHKGKGYAGPALVCRAKYIPISGYRPDHKAVEYLIKSDGIEAWLIPVPRANLFVPYQVVVPTPWGETNVVAKSFQVDWEGNGKIALVR